MIKNCLTCDKPFHTYPSKIALGRGKYCSKECTAHTLFQKGSTPWHKGRTNVYTPEQLKRMTEANKKIGLRLRAENSPHWKGGFIYKNRPMFLYKRWRKEVMAKSDRCVYCASRDSLEADHIIPYSLSDLLRFDPRNGQVLCHDCHRGKTRFDNKVIRLRKAAVT